MNLICLAPLFYLCFVEVSSLAVKRSPVEARATWTSLGCYTDNVGARSLSFGASVTGGANAMTVELCEQTCQGQGYTLAGLEYGGECYCGNSFQNGGGPAPDGNAGCNMKCNGNAAETCGGPNRLNVYSSSNSGSTGPTNPSSGKRGLAYNNNNPSSNAVYANLFKGYSKISWGYDWGFPSWSLDSQFEFVPMLWGLPSGADPDWTAAVQTPGTHYILGFNEPDLTYSGSANIAPAPAAAGYQQYIQPFANQVKIGTPNVLWNNVGSTSGGNYNSPQWMKNFIADCTGCHFDFAAIHWYQDCEPGGGQSGPDWFKGNVTNAYDTLGLPVWITEFQCYGSNDQQAAFLQNVLPWLDAQSYVQRYAYFGVFPGYLVNDAGNGLSVIGQAYATA
ncbi:glycosyl hydrolase catalytic core-domain-containing protein [Xylogone sp. PMI_703]|nr:glycosyl hydrolase catalytic core-domain-containing protein [Xylogone sp. PMI_703]